MPTHLGKPPISHTPWPVFPQVPRSATALTLALHRISELYSGQELSAANPDPTPPPHPSREISTFSSSLRSNRETAWLRDMNEGSGAIVTESNPGSSEVATWP